MAKQEHNATDKSQEYAVLALGSKQHIVAPGDEIEVELIADQEDGSKLTFDQVLLARSPKGVKVGTPYVQGASVKATVLGLSKGPKITVLHKRRRKHSRKRTGHRQHYTLLKIDSIQGV